MMFPHWLVRVGAFFVFTYEDKEEIMNKIICAFTIREAKKLVKNGETMVLSDWINRLRTIFPEHQFPTHNREVIYSSFRYASEKNDYEGMEALTQAFRNSKGPIWVNP